jgi:hypothetical protein
VGAAILGLVAFWFFRRRSHSAFPQQRPVNVLQDDEDGNEAQEYHHGLPQYYVPEPYFAPDSTTRATSEAASTHDRPLSMPFVTEDVRRAQGSQSPTTSTTTTTTRKSAAFSQSRPVNIIEHDDAGPSDLSGQVEPETIELPPAYSNIRQPQRSAFALAFASSTPGPTAAKDES